jgi:phage/plasmid-associated DNA primase
LLQRAGGAVLLWIIEGARKFIQNGFTLKMPQCVQNAINEYKTQNDWLGAFIAETCNTGNCFPQKSGELYTAYRNYSIARGEYVRSAADFLTALSAAGFPSHKTKTGNFIHGLSLRQSEHYSQ